MFGSQPQPRTVNPIDSIEHKTLFENKNHKNPAHFWAKNENGQFRKTKKIGLTPKITSTNPNTGQMQYFQLA